VLVRQIVLLSETSVRLFEQDYHFGPGGKHSPSRASYAKNLLAWPGRLLTNASGRVDFSKPECYIPNMKALGLIVSDRKIFENCILKTYFLTLWPTYANNRNCLNNFCRGPPRDYSCWVWSNSNERFKRRRCLSTHGRRDAGMMDNGSPQKLTLRHTTLNRNTNLQ